MASIYIVMQEHPDMYEPDQPIGYFTNRQAAEQLVQAMAGKQRCTIEEEPLDVPLIQMAPSMPAAPVPTPADQQAMDNPMSMASWVNRNCKFAKSTKVAEDGWPTHLKKGRFTEYCKRNGFDGPSKECADHAMKSDDESVRGMASFYSNTVKP